MTTIHLLDTVQRRTVGDVMTHEVVTVAPGTGFKKVASLLTEQRVSALPVVGAGGRLLGIVSEADLLPKERRLRRPFLTVRRRGWRAEQARVDARTADELMTAPAVTVDAAATLQSAARLMHHRGVRRLCITDSEGRLAGILTRGDLLRAFTRADEGICEQVRGDVLVPSRWVDPAEIRLTVTDGVVRLEGEVERRSDAETLAESAERVDGVVGVDDLRTWRFDDRAADEAPPLF